MSNNLRFDLAPAQRGRRLTITGPLALMNEAYAKSPETFKRSKIIKHHIYTLELAEDASMVAWTLNAKVLGRLHDQDMRNRKLEGINGFIYQVVSLARQRRGVEPDPKLNLTAYSPDGSGEFNFVADVVRPTADPATVRTLLGGNTLQMLEDLHYPCRGNREESARNELLGGTFYGRSGVKMPLGADSYVHSRGDDWDWTTDRFELVGNELEDGGGPLICLVGAIAIAHADELLQPRLVAQQG